jgi:acyl dehydratase
LNLAQLETGHKLGPYDVGLSVEESIMYAEAVGRECLPAAADQVPPMAVVAAGLGKLIDELELAGGTIHGSQGARFERPIVAGEKLSATAVLRGNSVRRGARFATLDTTFTDADGEVVATATSMVIVSP